MKTTDEAIIVEHTFDVSKERLWAAITESFTLTNEGRIFPHQWLVKEVKPKEELVVQWTFGGYPGVSLISYSLSAEGSMTKLTLTASVLEDYPSDIPEFKRESGLGGWNYFMKEALPKFFNGGS